jgi:hypothetical protein
MAPSAVRGAYEATKRSQLERPVHFSYPLRFTTTWFEVNWAGRVLETVQLEVLLVVSGGSFVVVGFEFKTNC